MLEYGQRHTAIVWGSIFIEVLMNRTVRFLCALFAGVIILSHFCVFAGVENGEAVVVLDSVSGVPGQSVDVNVTLTKNPGITGLRFFVLYDSDKLTLEKAVYTKIGGGGLTGINIKNNPVVLLWNVSLYEFTETGVLSTLTFKIKEGASVGSVPLKVTYGRGDCIDYDLKNLAMNITNGSVNIEYDGTNCKHTSKSTKVTREASCTESGTYEIVCNACSSVVSSGETARREHSYGTLIVTKEPSYTEVGLMEQKCSVCSDIRTEPIDMLKPPESSATEKDTDALSLPVSSSTSQLSPDTQTDAANTNGTPGTSVPSSTDRVTQAQGTDPAYTVPDTDRGTSAVDTTAVDTSPATGDDTAVLCAVCTAAFVMVAALILSRIREQRKFK